MDNSQVKFEDGDTPSFGYGGDKVQFRDIILQHLRKITQLASVEFRGGLWEERPHPNTNINAPSRIYIPDTRECYSNAIEVFSDMLLPYFDTEMKRVEDVARKANVEALKDNTYIKEPNRDDESPEETSLYKRKFGDVKDRISYRDERVRINRKLFRALCCFLYRQKYLEVGTMED